MRMSRFRMIAAIMMTVVIMIPAMRVSATEGGYGGHSSSNGTSTTASGETMYGKAAAESGGTGTMANEGSMGDKPVTSETVSTPDVENPIPESSTEPEQQDVPEQVPENNENQADATQLPESNMTDQNTNNVAVPAQTATVEIPEREIIAEFESKIPGVYQANSVEGCAVITEADEISRNYGLASGEEAYARFLDLDESKYPVSSRMLSLAADSQGAAVCARLNIELGKMTGGNYSLLASDGAVIRIVLGIPSSFLEEGRIYAVACVRKDGTVTILKDQDEVSGTVTVDVAGGAGTYAIIRY